VLQRNITHFNKKPDMIYTGCLKIRQFRIQSVVGDHFSSPNMEIEKIGTPPTNIHWSEGALLESSVFIVIYGD
jgi:hypothetical protein